MNKKHWLSNEDFNLIYDKVPRLNIDLVIRAGEKIVLVQRSIEPNIGLWHLPGGTVYKGEFIRDAVLRIAKNETGLDMLTIKGCIGYMEFPKERRGEIEVHTISIVFEVETVEKELKKDKNAKAIAYQNTMPSAMIAEHEKFLREYRILS